MPELSKERALAFRDAYFEHNPNTQNVFDLFEYLPSAHFYAKDAKHRYIGINKATLNNVFGLEHEYQLYGRTDSDFQPPALAEAYHAEDTRVMKGRKVIPNQVWLVPHVSGTPKWYVSTKTPLFDQNQKAIGIAGVMYPIDTPEEQAQYFGELGSVLKYMGDHYSEDIAMTDMAGMAKMSSTHFNQKFQKLLRISPTAYLLSLRTQKAQQLLTTSTKQIADIGYEVGFYDQSHFTKRFRKVTGMTPLAYRKAFR